MSTQKIAAADNQGQAATSSECVIDNKVATTADTDTTENTSPKDDKPKPGDNHTSNSKIQAEVNHGGGATIAGDINEDEDRPATTTTDGTNDDQHELSNQHQNTVTDSAIDQHPSTESNSDGSDKTVPNSGVEKQKGINSSIITTRSRTRSLSSAAASGRGSAAEDSPKKGDISTAGSNKKCTMATRSRTRSLSSACTALSSLSGGESMNGDGVSGANRNASNDDDGKTPHRTNQGPVRKRHKKGGPRALFHCDNSGQDRKGGDAGKEDATVLPPIESTNESETASSKNNQDTAGARRGRSSTIESFRAAMDSQYMDDVPTESIVCPDNTNSKTKLDNVLPPLPGLRERSDTIDFLSSPKKDQDSTGPAPISKSAETTKKVEILLPADLGGETKENGSGTKGIDFGKTPKKANLSRGPNQSTLQGPLRKRHKTRSLSFAKGEAQHAGMNREEGQAARKGSGASEDNVMVSELDTSLDGRMRSNTCNTLDLLERRSRSDTIDFLTAAVAGEYGHDLDAAIAAAGDDGASFAMHTVSAPSGASLKYNATHPPQRGLSSTASLGSGSARSGSVQIQRRSRSNTLDSTASSINSAKLDFLVSVAEQQADISSNLPAVESGALRERTDSTGGASEISSEQTPQRRPRSNTLEIYSNMASASRKRSDTVDFLIGAQDDDDQGMGNIDGVMNLGDQNESNAESENNGNVMDHLKALCDQPQIEVAKTAKILRRKREGLASPRTKAEEETSLPSKRSRKNSDSTSARKTSFSQGSLTNNRRNRLDSWGGMSDLSAGGMGNIAYTHSALRDTGILDDVIAAAADLGCESLSEGGESLEQLRSRAQSGGSNSLSGASPAATNAAALSKADKRGRQRLESLGALSLASLSDTSISIAGPKRALPPEEKSTEARAPTKEGAKASKDAASISTPSITVDYDAITAAVNAANAATDGLDLAVILGTPSSASTKNVPRSTTIAVNQPKSNPRLKPDVPMSAVKPSSSTAHKPSHPTTAISQQKSIPDNALSSTATSTQESKSTGHFPVTSINIPLVPIPKSTKSKEEMEAIRARARAAAGYVPPDGRKLPGRLPPRTFATPSSSVIRSAYPPPPHRHPPTSVPIKKRAPLSTPMSTSMPDRVQSLSTKTPLSYIKPAPAPSSTYSTKPSVALQSEQKWNDMFQCLVKFIEDTKEESTAKLNEEEKKSWVWDGNVPTSYKTPCGKALGRWINNQRSAKAKGTLKDQREIRLVSTGLKWSVLTTNSWRQMLRELEIYVNDQTKNGRVWDGNVPTNYKIKSNFVGDGEEEKNLGRWVNRQRSLFQSGKLKKDRQRDLERIGLRWSVLLTTSWPTMFAALRTYVDERRKESPHGVWDGNVPANFKTKSNPSLSLGRWVNRQRCAYAKNRLKAEHVKKLDDLGLKWAMHMRHEGDDNDDFVGGDFVQDALVPESVASNEVLIVSSTSAKHRTPASSAGDVAGVGVPSLPLPLPIAKSDNTPALSGAQSSAL